MTFQEFAKEAFRCSTVTTRLHEDVDHVTILIHGTPQIHPLTVDRYEHFVQEPGISESTLTSFQTPDILESELRAPPANGLVGNDNPSFSEQIFDIPEAQPELVVELDCVTNDFARIAVPVIEGSGGFHDASLAAMGPS